MPKGPNGEWRPAATGACAVHVMKIATGEIAETYDPPELDTDHAANSQRASKAGKARAASLTPARRKQIAKTAAAARWVAEA